LNSVARFRRVAIRIIRWTLCGFFFELLISVSGCQPDSQSGVADKEAPAEESTVAEAPLDEAAVDAADEEAQIPETNPVGMDEEVPVPEASADAAINTEAVADSGEPFCLELTSARDRVLLGEPLTLMLALRNCSDDLVQVRDLLGPEYGLLNVRIAHPESEQEQFYSPLVRRDGRGKGYVNLEAGEILTAAVPVYFGRDGWQVDRPGLYTFEAEYSVDDISMTSNAVSVNIENPSSEAEFAVARRFMSVEASTFYFLGGGDASGADELRGLIADQPNSLWAAYANLGLSIDLANDRKNTARAEACRSLEASLGGIKNDWIIALRGYVTLTNCMRESGLESEIPRVTEDFVRRHPDAEVVL
jgi:hypothetical protein